MGSSLPSHGQPSGWLLIVDQRHPDLETPLFKRQFGRPRFERMPLVECTGRPQQLLEPTVGAFSAEYLRGLVEGAGEFFSNKRQG
jgi:hypothetical protein